MIKQQRKVLIGIQYFVQGLTWILPSTIIYTYKTVPNYLILSIFEISKSITALKFIIAPFAETYTSIPYGRRKTWINLASIGMIITCLLTSFITEYKYVLFVALIAILHLFFNASEDVALDALSLKQISQAEQISWIQSAWNRGGRIVGSYIFVKLVSQNFGKKIGLQGSIMSVSGFYILVASSIAILVMYFHFSYKQPILNRQIRLEQIKKSFCQTISYYKIFFKPSRKQFRTSILFIIIYQGILFYSKTYKFQLMKQGYSKERINQFQNYSILPIMILAYFYGKLAVNNIWFHLKTIAWLKLALYIFGFMVHPTSFYGLLAFISVDNALDILRYLVDTIIVNSFPVTEFSAMTVSMLNSNWNLGQTSFVHMWIIQFVGHRYACAGGFLIQFLILLNLGRVCSWVENGECDAQQVVVHEQ